MPRTPTPQGQEHASPFVGEVYLACTPELKAKGLLKFGHTRAGVHSRQRNLTGAASTQKASILLCLPSPDSYEAEQLAKAFFEQRGYLVDPRREFIACPEDVAKDILREAVAHAPVRTRPSLKSAESTVRAWTCGNPGWAALLKISVKKGPVRRSLGEWLVISLNDGKTGRWLESRGIQCINWSKEAPEFELIFLDEAWANELAQAGVKLKHLADERCHRYATGIKVAAPT